MVTVTFPSRPQVATLPEPPAKTADDMNRQGFRGVFDLVQPETPRPEAAPPPDVSSPQDKTEDVVVPASGDPAPDIPQNPKTDQTDATVGGTGLAPLMAEPPADNAASEEILTETEPEPKLPLPLSDGVPVLQAMMTLMAYSPFVEAGQVALPEVGEAVPSPAVMAAQTAAGSDSAPVGGQPAPTGPVLPPFGDDTLLASPPTGEAVEETGLFILPRQAGTPESTSRPPTGVPAFWAAREAADAEPEAPDGPGPSGQVAGPKHLALPKPIGLPQMESAAALSAGEQTASQSDAKAALMPVQLQMFAAGSPQAAFVPTMLQAAVPTTLPLQVPAQIAAALAARHERPLEVRLAPLELGGLTVNLRQDGEILRVVVQADRPDTLDLLRRNGDLLLEELRLAGFSGAALSFSDGGGAQDRPEAAQSRLAPGADVAPPSLPANPQTFSPAQTAQGLDLRL